MRCCVKKSSENSPSWQSFKNILQNIGTKQSQSDVQFHSLNEVLSFALQFAGDNLGEKCHVGWFGGGSQGACGRCTKAVVGALTGDVCMCVCMYISICTHVRVCICMYLCMYVHVCMYVRVCACKGLIFFLNPLIHACMYVCMYDCRDMSDDTGHHIHTQLNHTCH